MVSRQGHKASPVSQSFLLATVGALPLPERRASGSPAVAADVFSQQDEAEEMALVVTEEARKADRQDFGHMTYEKVRSRRRRSNLHVVVIASNPSSM